MRVQARVLAFVCGSNPATLGVSGLTGDFTLGATFDALVIDPQAAGSPIDVYDGDGPAEVFQKWLMLGDDRNTSAVYVDGRQVLVA